MIQNIGSSIVFDLNFLKEPKYHIHDLRVYLFTMRLSSACIWLFQDSENEQWFCLTEIKLLDFKVKNNSDLLAASLFV